MNKELVVAGFSRDTSWTENIVNTRISVYKKGTDIKNNDIIIQNNIGRDVHTYFYHIVKNYYSLADYTFFSQDYPFDHCDNYIEIVNGNIDTWNTFAIQKLYGFWAFNTYWRKSLITDENGAPHHPCYLPIRDIWDLLYTSEIPKFIEFSAAEHMCITKEVILSNTLEFYKKILNILETHYLSPWIIERLKAHIFDINSKCIKK